MYIVMHDDTNDILQRWQHDNDDKDIHDLFIFVMLKQELLY